MRRSISHVVAAVTLIGFSASAGAQSTSQIPELKGQWNGKGEGIVLGSAPHNPSAPTPQQKPRVTSIEISIEVEGQEGRRFWGTVTSQHHKEPIIGIIGYDGKRVSMQDSDGTVDGTLTDADTMEILYRHLTQHSAVIAIDTLKRRK